MPISHAKRESLIQDLVKSKSKAISLHMALILQGHPAEARQVKIRIGKLTREIDGLLVAQMKEWTGNAAILTKRIRNNNRKLQIALGQVRRKRNVGGAVVRAVGYLDDVINVAVGLVA